MQQLYAYFTHNLKCHLEFYKLTKLVEKKGNKVIKNVHNKWINMFVPTKRVMEEYHTLLLKMGLDAPIEIKVNDNLTHLVDVEVLLSLSCVFPLLEVVHNLIKFSQMRDSFDCNFIVTIKICQEDVCFLYFNPSITFKSHVFHLFTSLAEVKNENILMKWITNPTTKTHHLTFD
jgi:hypothetical protein